MRKLGSYGSIFAFILCFYSLTVEAEPKQRFLVSHLQHPSMAPYKTLVKNAYEELGIRVDFVPMANIRGLVALNNGLVDADVLRMGVSSEQYPNIVVVPPALAYNQVYLICNKSVTCDESVLFQPERYIYASKREIQLIKARFKSDIKANLVEFERYATLLDLLALERVEYIVFGWARGQKAPDGMTEKYNYQKLLDAEVTHVINKKHRAKKEAISDALRKQLTVFNSAASE